MKRMLLALAALAVAGCATVELSSAGLMKNGDRLLVIQSNGYEFLWILPLFSGELTWDAKERRVDSSPVFFANHSDTQHLWEMAWRIAERENCDLVDVTFIDNYLALNPSVSYSGLSTVFGVFSVIGLVKTSDTAISAVLRPRQSREEPSHE